MKFWTDPRRRWWRAFLIAGGTAVVAVGWLAMRSTTASAGAPRTFVAEPWRKDSRPLTDEEKEVNVLCQYIVFAAPRFICGKPPLEDVKKRCDERATEERGEPSECSCTQDQGYIRDVCD